MKYVKCILALTLICAVMTAALAVANSVTAPIIAANDAAKANDALLIVLPSGEGFTSVDVSAIELPQSVDEVYTEKNGGTVVKLTVTGFNPNMTLMVGINADGTVSGATCLSSEETLGYEKTYGDSVIGATISTVDAIDTVSGATKTTAAYKSAVRDALNTAIIVGGGEAQKSDEEILAENLAAALPEAEGFKPSYAYNSIDGVNVYIATNGAGYVYSVGEKFVGVAKDGSFVGEADADVAAVMEKIMPIDISAYENMPSAIMAAFKSADGNYLFDIKGSGYGINGGDKYHPASGEFIYIFASASASGEIIDCVTVSHMESKGFGDACGNADYYSQFNGKTQENYKEVDAIAGATLTSKGYVNAIGKVFEAVTILNGGAN